MRLNLSVHALQRLLDLLVSAIQYNIIVSSLPSRVLQFGLPTTKYTPLLSVTIALVKLGGPEHLRIVNGIPCWVPTACLTLREPPKQRKFITTNRPRPP